MEQIPSIDGTRIGYWRSGAGQPLLLVHGTTADHGRWSAVVPRLEQHFTIYAMDRRGRGASGDAEDYDLLREAEDVAALVEAVCAEAAGEPVNVLAHSYGAVCSLEASRLTGQMRRLILYEPPVPTGQPMYPPGFAQQMQALIDRGEREAALEAFMRQVVKMPEDGLKAYRQLPMWQTRIQLAPTIPREMVLDQTYNFQPEKFANHAIPTLLLLGGDSPPIFQQAIALLKSALPNAQVVVLPGQQHVAMDTNPDLFLQEVLKFLQA